LEFFVFAMPSCVAFGFLSQVFVEGFRQIDSGLIRKTNQHEQHVRQLIFQRNLLVRFLEALFAVSPRNDPSHFADFFDQLSQISQLGKVSHTDVLNPLVDFILSLPQGERFGRLIFR